MAYAHWRQFWRGRDYTIFHAGDSAFWHGHLFRGHGPDLYRHFVQQDVDFMVNVTNDAWFKTSPDSAIHLANAVFRAVENHRPLVRASNNGMTCVINEHGSLRARARRLAREPEIRFVAVK